ncbi:MAG: hypothetical protein EOP83_36780 [Verrucomicrobiaceae bacterium]|nr:MAG: hypothetical protein EOP83_36780 [Verrucomicrobiaceae bacterium]
MKTRILSAIAALAAFLTTIGGLDLSGIISLLPDTVATGFAVALPSLAGVVHLLKAIGDFADDGKINGSFLLPFALLGGLGACVLALSMTSCSVTTLPDGTQTRRVDQGAVNPWLELARDLFVSQRQEEVEPAPTVQPAK